jgi:hypothetical protein
MFIVQIALVDSSAHSQLSDAEVQMQRFIDSGYTDVEIVEKDSYTPASE